MKIILFINKYLSEYAVKESSVYTKKNVLIVRMETILFIVNKISETNSPVYLIEHECHSENIRNRR